MPIERTDLWKHRRHASEFLTRYKSTTEHMAVLSTVTLSAQQRSFLLGESCPKSYNSIISQPSLYIYILLANTKLYKAELKKIQNVAI